MLTDHRNRPYLAWALAANAVLTALVALGMALTSATHELPTDLGTATGVWYFLLAIVLLASIVCAAIWVHDAPILQQLHDTHVILGPLYAWSAEALGWIVMTFLILGPLAYPCAGYACGCTIISAAAARRQFQRVRSESLPPIFRRFPRPAV